MSSRKSTSGGRCAHVSMLGAALVLISGCLPVRYQEAFEPDGDISQVIVRAQSGSVELAVGDDLRIERAIRGPEGTLELSHTVQDGTLILEARCTTILPCAVDSRIELPEGVAATIELGEGEVWATGLPKLDVALGEGTVDVDIIGGLSVRVGSGSVHATLHDPSETRIAVGDGDIDVSVPPGEWRIDATAAHLTVEGVESVDHATSVLKLVAPGGTVVVRGAQELVRR